MAKTKMICPFSGELCRGCPIYRGRHYYLCFYSKYRGHLVEPEEVSETVTTPTSELGPNKVFEIPYIKLPNIEPIKAIDPYFIVKRGGS